VIELALGQNRRERSPHEPHLIRLADSLVWRRNRLGRGADWLQTVTTGSRIEARIQEMPEVFAALPKEAQKDIK